MSLESAEDARRIAGLSRAEYDLLRRYLEQLPPEGWTEQSAASEWQVYQVVSHIGSQPAIHGGMIKAGLRGEPPMTDEQRRAIWGYFDNLKPDEVLAAYRKNNDEFVSLADSFTDEELGRGIPWIGGQSAPMAAVLAGRLNEQVLHTWDVKQARDKNARLTPEAVPILLELNLTPARLPNMVKLERAPQLAGKSIRFELSDGGEPVALKLAEGGSTATRGGSGPADPSASSGQVLTVTLPAEALVRLIWGRYDVQGGLRSGELKLSDRSMGEALQAVFPGR